MSVVRQKPEKPRPDFPLSPANNGQWCKKIRGRIHYFGIWRDPDAAEQEYLRVREYLQAGRLPPTTTEGHRMKDLCNRFLTAKKHQVDSGELSPRTFNDYFTACAVILDHFGKERAIEDCRIEDFEAFRKKISEGRGLHAIGRMVTVVRMLFGFAFESEMIEKPIRFGTTFTRPSKKSMRIHRAKKQGQHGLRMFEAPELRRLLKAAPVTLKAMILLAINGGLGNSDIANLTRNSINGSWLNFPRVKTGIDRRIPLWPETIEAIEAAAGERRKVVNSEDSELCFLTAHGRRWVRTGPSGKSNIDKISDTFKALLVELEMKREGLGFYAIRHTFETVAGGTGDQVAVDAIMGHVDPGMSAVYRERIEDDRLRKVTEHVREWLSLGTED